MPHRGLAVVEPERNRGEKRRGRGAHAGAPLANTGVDLMQLFTAGEGAPYGAVRRNRQGRRKGAVGNVVDRRIERPVQHLVQHANGGRVTLPHFGQLLLDLSAVGPGPEERFRGRAAGRDQAAGNTFVFLDQRQCGGKDLNATARPCLCEVSALHVGRETARSGVACRQSSRLFAAIVRENRRVEERRRSAGVSHDARKRDIEIRGESILTESVEAV
jgi:hypothetical protein